jgi:hypothetical protein
MDLTELTPEQIDAFLKENLEGELEVSYTFENNKISAKVPLTQFKSIKQLGINALSEVSNALFTEVILQHYNKISETEKDAEQQSNVELTKETE